SLQPQVQQSKAWVLDIEVQVQALAQFQVRLKLLGLVIASHFVGPARFYAAKDRYQALFNAILLSDFSRQLFLGQGAAAQVGEWALEGLGQSLGTLADLVGQSRGKLLEVFAQHLGFAQILLENFGAIQVAQRTLKAQAVEGAKNTHDIFLVFLYKKVRGAVCWSRAFLFHETLLLHQARPVSSSLLHGLLTRLRLCRARFIVGKCRYADLPIGPSEGLCFCSTISIASFVLLPFRILCNAGLSTTSFSRSSCANSSSASLQEDKKLRTSGARRSTVA